MEFKVAARTDQGKVRAQNEDNFCSDLPLVAIADGMGGHKAGEVASELALEVMRSWKERLEQADTSALADQMRKAVEEANRTVFAKGREDQSLRGMGTTLTAAWVSGSNATVAQVGDSRAYLLRGDKLEQLTEDQTMVHQWEKEGKLEPGEAARHPHRHLLTQAIGSDSGLNVEVMTVELAPGDRFLLSTDGLHGMVGHERIKEILLAHPDPEDACGALVDAANEAGGEDNITILVLDAVAADESEAAGAGPVIVSKPTAGHTPGRRKRHKLRRPALLGLLALLVAAVIGAGAVWRQAQVQYVVSTRGGHVALLSGKPGQNGNPAMGEVVHVYEDAPLSTIARTHRRELRSGIPVESQQEADRLVANLPRVLGPTDTPPPATPPPTPEPTPFPLRP